MASAKVFGKLFFLLCTSYVVAVTSCYILLESSSNFSLGEIFREHLFGSVAIAIIVLGCAAVSLATILRPLRELKETADSLAKGNLNRPIPRSGTDEFGDLATALVKIQKKTVARVTSLKDYNDRLETVLGSMDDGVLAIATDQTILLANRASRQFLNFTTDESVGRDLLEVSRSRILHESVTHAFKTNLPSEREFESQGKQRYTLSLRVTPLPGDPCPGVVVVLHDVTELRRLENMRSEFVANVSHELKTPLSSIKAYAETLRLGAIDDAENNFTFLARIEEQAERLYQLILDLLQIARIESGEEAIDMIELALDEVALSTVASHRDEAEIKNITVTVAHTPISLIRADEDGIRAILDNLINNAIKYTPDGGNVNITWFDENESVVLVVEDTGIGIPEGDLNRVFERFYRVDKARSREMGGTGLGLSIVKHLTQSFRGSVSVTSKPDKGSRFVVTFPKLNVP